MKFIKRGKAKRFLSFLICAIFIIMMPGCSKINKNVISTPNDTITKGKLTSREQQIVNGMGADKFCIYNINLSNKKINWVNYWVEYYENGVLKKKIGDFGNSLSKEGSNRGTLIFSTQSNSSSATDEKWIISCDLKGGTDTWSTIVKKPIINCCSEFVQREKSKIIINKAINLAIMQEVPMKKNGAIIPGYSFVNSNWEFKRIPKESNIYVFKCKFIHKEHLKGIS